MTMRDVPPPMGEPVMTGGSDVRGGPAAEDGPDPYDGPDGPQPGVRGRLGRTGQARVPVRPDTGMRPGSSPLAVAAFAVGVVALMLLAFGIWGTAGLTGDSPLLLLALLAGAAALGLCPMVAVLGCVLATLAIVLIRRSGRRTFHPRDSPGEVPWNTAWNTHSHPLGGMGLAVAGLVPPRGP